MGELKMEWKWNCIWIIELVDINTQLGLIVNEHVIPLNRKPNAPIPKCSNTHTHIQTHNPETAVKHNGLIDCL